MSMVTYTAKKGLSILGSEVGAWLSDTVAEVVTGTQEITNGDFTGIGNITGWTLNPTATNNNGVNIFDITAGGATNEIATQVISGLTVSKNYVLSFERISGTASSSIEVDGVLTPQWSSTVGYSHGSFIATNTSHTVRIKSNDAAEQIILDNIFVRQSDNDLSTNGHDLAYYGSITKSVAATGSEVMAYSGFNTANYLQQPYDATLDLSSEVSVIAWVNTDSATDQTLLDSSSTSDDGGYALRIDSDGKASFVVRSDAGADVGNAGGTITNDGTWKLIVGTMDASGNVKVYVNKTLDSLTTGGSLGITTTPLSVGRGTVTANPMAGSLALVRVLPTALTEAQIINIYNSERAMFSANSVFTQVGLSYSLDLSDDVMTRSEVPVNNSAMSLSGEEESIQHRVDVFYDSNIILLTKEDLPRIRNFSQSVNNKETFIFDPYGSIATPDEPISVKADGGHTESRIGTSDDFTISMRVREV